MIGMTETAGLDRIRARSFGAAGADYDKYRPRYPDQLVDDVVAVLPGRHVLEVGAGTGIATAAFVGGGMIALFWNEDHYTDPRVLDAYAAAYDRRGIEIRSVRQEPAPSSDPNKI